MAQRAGRLVQLVAALGGAAVGAAGVIGALVGEGPVAPWVTRLFAVWCVATPYWWYLEHRLLAPEGAEARAEFAARQAHSRLVWFGFALAMGVLVIARAG